METWLILFAILVVVGILISTYVSRQLSDKDKDKIESQGIFPGSTQSSVPPRRFMTRHADEDMPDRSQPIRRNKAPEVESSGRGKKSVGVFRNKEDIKRAIIINEILKRRE